MEIKISDSTKEIIEQYQAEIASAENALNIAKKAANDILNIILFESFIDPNKATNLELTDNLITFEYEKDKKAVQGDKVRKDTDKPDS